MMTDANDSNEHLAKRNTNNIKHEGKIRTNKFMSMNAYSRHKKLCNDYIRYYSGGKSFEEVFKRDSSKDKTDLDVIREEMQFVWDEEGEEATSWEKRLAKKYYDKLFKEYCICDLSFYKENKVAMRWRIEKEVLEGKGQFCCGAKRCPIRDGLKSWEVNFAYIEKGEKKNALVKLRLCPDCSHKLNYFHQKKEVVKPKTTKALDKSIAKDLTKKSRKSKEPITVSDDDEEKETREENLPSNKKQRTVNEEKTPVAEKASVSRETKEGNMIVLESGDEMWKANLESKSSLDETQTREDDFENYLEDLLL